MGKFLVRKLYSKIIYLYFLHVIIFFNVFSQAPSVFMTDDSSAEKNSLSTIWPPATQSLCHFHVAQAEWRWLNSNSSDMCKTEIQSVMKLSQAVS